MILWKQRLFSRLQSPEPGETGGGAPPTISPEVQILIDKGIEIAVSGLKTKNSELLGKLRGSADELKKFEGIDPVAVHAILSKFSSEEEAGLIAKGDIETVLRKRTERMQADFTKQLDKEVSERNRILGANKKLSGRALSEAIMKAATKAGALPEALEDIVLRAKGLFTVNDDGEVIAMNGEEVILGKDGKTPLTPIEWAESLRETATHRWPRAQGSNAPGSGAHGKAGVDLSQLPPAERISKAREMAGA